MGLLPTTARSADEMTWFQLPGHVVLHVGNAWQADGKVHVYVAGFKEFHMRVDKEWRPWIARYQLDVRTGKATMEWLNENMEMPTVSPMRASLPSRYLYPVHIADLGKGVQAACGIGKLDTTKPG